MIDLHSHILHELDDGTRSLDAAVEMARSAVADGVTVMAATPHGSSSANAGVTRYNVPALRARLHELRTALTAAAIPLELVLGTEIYGEPGVVERLRAGELLSYAGVRAVLLEFPLAVAPTAVAQLLFAFQLVGYRVVVAHPERYRFVQDDPSSLVALVERGALMQLTADALLGNQGERLRRLAEQLLAHGLIQLIATDAHGPHFNRLPNLGAARARATTLLSDEAADSLTRLVPAAVLSGGELPLADPRPVRRRFGLF